MDDSPRLIQNLRSDAQKREARRAFGTSSAHTPYVDCVVESVGFAADHTQTTHATGEKPHTRQRPTSAPRTSDTLHRQLDERIRLRLAQLEVLPGPVSGKGVEQTSQSSERGLPISWTGNAKGVDEDNVFAFRLRVSRAKSIRAKAGVLKDLNEAIQTITVSKVKGRPEFDLSVKEGRIAAGRLAQDHGVKWACQALGGVPDRTMRRYRDEYRRAS
jgi:hypothetical protein